MSSQPERQLSPQEEQEKWLKEGSTQVKSQAFHMKRALDKGLLKEALKFCSNMLSELRTSALTPKNYYELYMVVFDELRHMESFFFEEYQRGKRVEEMYEIVQHAGNIVPRLYLLVTVGSVFIKSKEAPAKDVLKDLVEMCKGVQHPTRGLFLRHYLSQMSKDKLPDDGSEYGGQGGSVLDSVDFVLQNFNEMVKLWVRLQNQGPVREREKREKERMELRILVGTNLVRLSQLEGVVMDLYKENVLPRVLDIIISCKDKIAQQYLMECIIQVFPDEFHLMTLDKFLSACMDLQPGVDLEAILTSLMNRLAKYGQQNPAKMTDDSASGGAGINVFEIFSAFIEQTVNKGLELSDFLSVQIALLNLAVKCYPLVTEYVNTILGKCADQVKQKATASDIVELIKKLLTIPIESYQNVLIILQISRYIDVMALLQYNERRAVAVELVRSALKYMHKITSWEQVNKLFELIRPLVKDEDDQPDDSEMDPADFEEEQNLVARLVHLFDNENTDVLFKVYSAARKHFGQGGIRRIGFTLVPLVFSYLRLAQRINQQASQGGAERTIREEKVFQYTLEILEVLAGQKPQLALRLYLQTALCADRCKLEKIVYEVMSQAFVLYEEEINEIKIQLSYLTQIIATLQALSHFGEENYDTLATQACQYSSKLLKKPDQCVAAFLCSHLFWPISKSQEGCRNSSKVLECLQRSLKIVESCMQAQQIPLFVEILNKYLYHYDQKNDKVTTKYLNGLIDLINTNISRVEEEESQHPNVAPINVFYRNTIRHISIMKESSEDRERYFDVRV